MVSACGGGQQNAGRQFAPDNVEAAFRAHGFALHRLASNGAEQPAMGETSACATRFSATPAPGTVTIFVCDDAHAATSVPTSAFRRTRENVVVTYTGGDRATRARIAEALSGLD